MDRNLSFDAPDLNREAVIARTVTGSRPAEDGYGYGDDDEEWMDMAKSRSTGMSSSMSSKLLGEELYRDSPILVAYPHSNKV